MSAFAGCTHTATYGYQYRLDQVFGGAEEPEVPPVEARQLLANARTVAFYPPDICVNTEKQSDRASTVVARCGVLLSKLERDAERAGYEVVSWVNLRGSSRPIEYAREAKVDVLFEINELLPQRIKDVDAKRKLTFFDRPQDAPDQELQVSATVAERCHAWSIQHDRQSDVGLTSTLDIKTVSVADGRARWHYRKTVSEASGQEFPKTRFVGISQPNKAGTTLFSIGAALVISSIVFLVVDASVTSGTDPITMMPNKKVFGDAPYYALVPAALLTGAGIAVMAGTGHSKPDPDKVLCLEDHVPSNGVVDTSTATGGRSGAYTFDESRASDPLAKEEEKLGGDRVNEFFAILTAIHTARPPVGTPAPAPMPTTAPNHP